MKNNVPSHFHDLRWHVATCVPFGSGRDRSSSRSLVESDTGGGHSIFYHGKNVLHL